MNGLTAPGIQANEELYFAACARAEVGWGRDPESGCEIGVLDFTDAVCKRQLKEKQSFS